MGTCAGKAREPKGKFRRYREMRFRTSKHKLAKNGRECSKCPEDEVLQYYAINVSDLV